MKWVVEKKIDVLWSIMLISFAVKEYILQMLENSDLDDISSEFQSNDFKYWCVHYHDHLLKIK